jgi:hypothetical protein
MSIGKDLSPLFVKIKGITTSVIFCGFDKADGTPYLFIGTEYFGEEPP